MSDSRLFTFKSGGWVIALAVLLSTALFVWAALPIILKDRPPGDGRNPDSYGFDLSALLIPRSEIATPMLYRDMPPRLDYPETLTTAQAWAINEEQRGKYLVTTDRIVGVVINGEARAYPISVLTVHEIINDTVGGIPIAVTYSWPSDAVRVFDRRVGDEVLEFGVSGLIYNANLLMYDRRDTDPSIDYKDRNESLWSQLQGRAVSGPAADAGHTLSPIPAQLVSWEHWQQMHPETLVIQRDQSLLKRYRRAEPAQYFISEAPPPFPVKPLVAEAEGLPQWKDRIIAVQVNDERRVYPVAQLIRRASESSRAAVDAKGRPTWNDTLGGVQLIFTIDAPSNTVAVHSAADEPFELVHAFWFAWHAMYPEDELAE